MAILTLPNGMKIEGTSEQIRSTLSALGYKDISIGGKYYESSSKGLILISDMDTNHLRNAALKLYGEWVGSLHRITDPQELASAIIDGISDPVFRSMVVELSKRDE